MSAVKDTGPRFMAKDYRDGPFPAAVLDRSTPSTDVYVDHYRSFKSAAYAARMLNAGLAWVSPHACIGCKVVVR